MRTKMNRQPLRLSALLASSLALGLLVGPAAAWQDTEGDDFPSMDEILGGNGAAPEEDAEARIRRLFGEVETKLKRVDILLTDAAAGDTSALAGVEESGIADLLKSSIESGRQAQEDIREIIEAAKQMQSQQQSSSSSSGSENSEGPSSGSNSSDPNSPLNRGQQSQSRESTPEAPSEQQPGQNGEQPQPGGEKPQQPGESGQPEPQPGGSDPKNPNGDPEQDGENRPNQGDSADATGSKSSPVGNDGWGDLPTHVRDTFRSEGRTELPARYRDWIDDYYRKMNKRGPRR